MTEFVEGPPRAREISNVVVVHFQAMMVALRVMLAPYVERLQTKIAEKAVVAHPIAARHPPTKSGEERDVAADVGVGGNAG